MEEGYSFNSHVVLLLRKDRGGPITWFFIHKYLQLRAKDKLSPSKIELTLVLLASLLHLKMFKGL